MRNSAKIEKREWNRTPITTRSSIIGISKGAGGDPRSTGKGAKSIIGNMLWNILGNTTKRIN